MKDYTGIYGPIFSFTATILGSVVPTIANQQYTQNSAPLSIAFDSFEVLPSDYDVGPTKIDAFVFKGATLPKYVDPTCDCMTNIVDLDWITLDLTSKSLLVQTSN